MAGTIPSQIGVTHRGHGRHNDGDDDDSSRDRHCWRRHHGRWCRPRCPYTDHWTWLYLGNGRSYLVYGSGPIIPYPYPYTYPHYYFPGTYVPPTSFVPVYGTPGLHYPVQAIAYPGSVPLAARAGVPRQFPQPRPDADGANLEEAKQRERERAGQRAAEAEEEARQALALGDQFFAAGRYHDAILRYRAAIRATPQAPKPLFRQALALVAVGNYPTAVELVKRGIQLDPGWPESGFHLDQLYQGDQVAKRTHIGDLARAVNADPENPDLLFLLGMMLHFDGDREASAEFFAQAAQFEKGFAPHLTAFQDRAAGD